MPVPIFSLFLSFAEKEYQTESKQNETFAPIARLESIRMLLAFASHHDFKLKQMDVKGAFLNGPLNEFVYVKQPPGFEDSKLPNHVFSK